MSTVRLSGSNRPVSSPVVGRLVGDVGPAIDDVRSAIDEVGTAIKERILDTVEILVGPAR